MFLNPWKGSFAMPEVVLRNPDGSPFIVNVNVGEKVPYFYAARGCTIDADTSAEDARSEIDQAAQDAAAQAVEVEAAFVPVFEDAPADAPAAPDVAATVPPVDPPAPDAPSPGPVPDPSSGAPDPSTPQGDSPDVTKE